MIKELGAVPEIIIDPDELKQVFINLINNAINAMPDGGDLTIKTFKETADVCVQVSDTGVGIAQENIPRIFDPFFSTRHESAGLGLSIVHRIITKYGGTIDVKSKIKEGTMFTLKFPAA